MRLVVAADTDALDDWEFNHDGDVIAPGGREVAVWLQAGLSDGHLASSDVQSHSGYGWSFELRSGEERIWSLVAMGADKGSMYFWAERQPKFWQRLIGRRETSHLPTLQKAERLMEADARFHQVKIQAPGA